MLITYSEKFNLAYKVVPKSASTSIQNWIYHIEDLKYSPELGNDGMQRSISVSRKEFAMRFGSYFCFTSVRNPFSRLVSCYLDKFVFSAFEKGIRKKSSSIKAYQKSLDNFYNLEQYAVNKLAVDYEKGMSFEDFLRAIQSDWASNPNSERTDPHWGLQYSSGLFELMSYNHICHVENLEQDINFVQDKLGIPDEYKFNNNDNKVRKVNIVETADYLGNIPASELSKSSLCKKVSEKYFYSLESVQIVKEKFSKDLEYFKYDDLGYI